jgi:hypothetical protein
MSNNQQMVMNRIKVVLAEKQRTIDGWQSKWVSPRIQFQDGVPISHSRLLPNYKRLQTC